MLVVNNAKFAIASELTRFALLCAVTSLLWSTAQAQSVARVGVGRQIALTKCASCHGLDGNAPNSQFPKLAGQIDAFVALQLRNYRSGERPNPVMTGIAKQLTTEQIDSVAA